MLKKIYQELAAIRKELQAIRGSLEHIRKHPFNLVTKFVCSSNSNTGKANQEIIEPDQKKPEEWRRFEMLTESEAERERLERILEERNLSRQDLAIILFGLRVRPEFGKEHFGI